MKNLSKLFMLSIAVLIGSCTEQWDGTTWSVVAEPERTIGFVTGENAEMQWHLGTQDAIDIVSTVDGLWAAQDYEAMRPYFADSLVFTRSNGSVTNTFDDFIAIQSSGTQVTWEYNYAYSVDLNPSVGGEYVNAGFEVTYPATDDSEEVVNWNHENYFVQDGKIISLTQYTVENVDKE
tara:strand:+ start:114 stop:647 length:534 start_codon:yes stop_codon:yes gene_type:complete